MEEENTEKRAKFDEQAGKSIEEEGGDLSNSRNLDRALRLDEVDDEFERIKRRRKNPGVAIVMQVFFCSRITVYTKIDFLHTETHAHVYVQAHQSMPCGLQ